METSSASSVLIGGNIESPRHQTISSLITHRVVIPALLVILLRLLQLQQIRPGALQARLAQSMSPWFPGDISKATAYPAPLPFSYFQHTKPLEDWLTRCLPMLLAPVSYMDSTRSIPKRLPIPEPPSWRIAAFQKDSSESPRRWAWKVQWKVQWASWKYVEMIGILSHRNCTLP